MLLASYNNILDGLWYSRSMDATISLYFVFQISSCVIQFSILTYIQILFLPT